jgi:hypothetical protein
MEKGDRRYGPVGFTTTSEVRAILAPDDLSLGGFHDYDTEDLFRFNGLPWREARELLKLLPEQNARDHQNAAPTFEQFVDLGREFPEIRFHGYRIDPSRGDERITIEGFLHPLGERAEALYRRVCEIAAEPDTFERAE